MGQRAVALATLGEMPDECAPVAGGKFLLDENVSYRVAGHLKAPRPITGLVTGDHDFVQMLFASGDTSPSLILVREVETLRSAELAELLIVRSPQGSRRCRPTA